VCNALRNDLNHSNEFVRGSMLRLLCKLREPEIIEPLLPSIKVCLEHRHSYVRRHSALALHHIRKHFGQALIPDGAELVEKFISVETDLGSRRNAFLMLFNEAEDVAIEFLTVNASEFDRFGDGFALLVLELTRKVCRRDPAQKSQFVRFLFQLLGSASAAVCYEAAWTLASLSSSPTAVRAAASTYTALLCSQSDNNVKLIVLERLAEIKRRHSRVLSEILMDVLRALASPNVDICKRTLEITMSLVSNRNIDEVLQVLKREIIRTRTSDMERGAEYRALLINSIHSCASRFPSVAESVTHVLMDFLGLDGAVDVIIFIRSIVQQYPSLCPVVLEQLLASFSEIQAPPVLATTLWILGEYVELDLLDRCFGVIAQGLGGPLASVGTIDDVSPDIPRQLHPSSPRSKSVVLEDGTYASQAVATESDAVLTDSTPHLRRIILSGDIYLGTITASALTKLTLKTIQQYGSCSVLAKQRQCSTIVLCCELGDLANSKVLATPDPVTSQYADAEDLSSSSVADSIERLAFLIHLLLDPSPGQTSALWLLEGKTSFQCCLQYRNKTELGTAFSAPSDDKLHSASNQPDDLIMWRQLRQASTDNIALELYDVGDLQRATGLREATDSFGVKLSHVYQLSGFTDPVYAEACVTVHDYDIVLEILIINRTTSTLTNLTVELATMGDLKLVERPQSLTLAPSAQHSIRANIKVSSTETGHIFGTIVFEKSSSAEKTYVNLNNIHLDIMDYIRPAGCSDDSFRHMWAEFEWENKVAIATSITGLEDFLEHIVECTNMRCLTPQSSLDGSSTFLAANLYAKSIFGEDALVNVSVEKKDDADGKLSGYIRIRSKTQGIALSLGDRITAVQRGMAKIS